MIRINLMKGRRSKPEKHGHAARNIVIVCAAAALAAGGAFLAWNNRALFMPSPVSEQPVVVKKEIAPSTFSRSRIVEEVIKEVSDSRQKLSLSVPYGELSFAQKINYEILFAKNVADLIARAVPAGIGLRSLETDNFQTVYAVGLCSSKDLIQSMLATLKNEGVTLLPPPYSFIKPNEDHSFRFVITCKVEFGLKGADQVADSPVPTNNNLPAIIKKYEQCMKESSISFSKGLTHVSTEKVGSYYRHVYQWTGKGSYANFTKMIMRLYDMKMVCAFKNISLVAMSGSTLAIDSHVILTTRQ